MVPDVGYLVGCHHGSDVDICQIMHVGPLGILARLHLLGSAFLVRQACEYPGTIRMALVDDEEEVEALQESQRNEVSQARLPACI